MTTAMKIKSIAPWFGGKRTLAPRIVRELGVHVQYFEPFGGSLAVLLVKPPVPHETVNDLHGDVTNLARVLADPELVGGLYERLQGTLFADGILRDAEQVLSDRFDDVAPDPERAYWYFVASWMGRNGVSGTLRCREGGFSLAVRWTAGGGSPTVRFRNAIESIPPWHERLRNVVIVSRCAFDILPRIHDAPGLSIYADPPYPHETRSGLRHASSEARYEHEFDPPDDLFGGVDDHARLAAALRRFEHARIVLSSYVCPRIRDLYAGWTVVDCKMNKQLHAQNGRGARKKEAPEILLINGPSEAE